VKQHLQRQSGVANVDVSLIDGKVEIVPKEDGKIDPAQLLKATYDSGVSVAELDMIARGQDREGLFGRSCSSGDTKSVVRDCPKRIVE
jgi:hypothetical protein